MLRHVLERAREWAGDKLVGLGLRVLGANTRVNFAPPPVIGEEEDEEPIDIDAVVPSPVISARGLAMIEDAQHARRWHIPTNPAPDAPLEGSLQERVARAREALGE